MTDAQKDALSKASVILGEHFDSYVVVVAVLSEDGKQSAVQASHGGGFHSALGLLDDAHDAYLHRNFGHREDT